MQAGETTTITITNFEYSYGQLLPMGGVSVVSTDPSVLQIEQDPTLESPVVTLHALKSGTAYVQPIDSSIAAPLRLVTVRIGSCLPVSARPQVTQVEALAGSPVDLRVFMDDPSTVATWYEEKFGGWSPIPFATGDVYVFQPKTSGTYRFLVRYADHCDNVSTLITVVASTRIRAVRR